MLLHLPKHDDRIAVSIREAARLGPAAFDKAVIANGHPHRLRDSFAVGLLQAGVPMERVSVLLGHSSIKVTERYYSPWVRARQEQLEADVRRSWTPLEPVSASVA